MKIILDTNGKKFASLQPAAEAEKLKRGGKRKQKLFSNKICEREKRLYLCSRFGNEEKQRIEKATMVF